MSHHAELTDHRTVMVSLDADLRAELTTRRDLPALLRLAAQASLIAMLVTLILWKVPFWPLLMLPLGILLVFLFTLQHEATHETAFRSDWLNRAVAFGTGLVLVVPPHWFRAFHFAHHRHTQDPENDPELEGGKPETWRAYVWHVTGIPLWRAMITSLVGNAIGPVTAPYVPSRARMRVQREARLFLALYAVVATASFVAGSAVLVWVWIVPVILGQPFLRLYLLAEHGRCPFVSNMLDNTRTTYTNAAIRFLAWNMPFHAEHHAAPAVPFHQLPRLNEMIAERLSQTSEGYRGFHSEFVGSFKPDADLARK